MRLYNFMFLFLSFYYFSNAQIILANEIAVSNDDWQAGDGFSAWDPNYGTSTGRYIGNPGDIGLSTTDIGTVSFALYATGTEWVDMLLPLDQPMQVGEKLTFYWAINWDANHQDGSKGFEFLTSSGVFYTVINEGSSSTIQAGGQDADTAYGINPMLVTLYRLSETQYEFTMRKRSNVSQEYSFTIDEPNALNRIKFFCGNQQDSSGERNMFFNKFKIQTNSTSLTIDTDRTVGYLEVMSSSTLTIAKNGSLKVNGKFNNDNGGAVTLNSDADEFSSIIVEGTSSGNITYNRYVNIAVDSGSNEWDLVGSPVGDLSISSFVSSNSSSLANDGSGTYALGEYNNSNDSWTNHSSSAPLSGNFTLGKGYQMASTSGTTLAFTGTVATTTQTQSIVNNHGNDSSGRRWNLVANPFPSYIHLNDNNDASNNFLTVNSSVIDNTHYAAVYGYDADGSGYTIYNNAADSPSDYIAPGQAFMVAAESSFAANISFTPAMRTTSGGDDFVSGRLAQSTWSRFYLRLNEDENFVSETKFYFDEGLSLGLDPGYDAGAMGQDDLMSRLVEQDQGVGMAINAMGLSALDEETIIPLVINRDAGVEFSVSFEDSTIPEDVGVYLEDTLFETLTDLRSEDFTLTPESDLSDMGRFYLRIGNTSLGGNDLDESYISIYKAASDDFVTIEGLSNVEKANVQLFNIIGQEVLNKTLNSNQSTQRLSTSGLTTGIYVIRLQADSSVIAKKIIIN